MSTNTTKTISEKIKGKINGISTKITNKINSISIPENLRPTLDKDQIEKINNSFNKNINDPINKISSNVISLKDEIIPTNIFHGLKNSIKFDKNASLHIFENKFKSLGKTLDKYMEEIAFDQNTKSGKIDNEHIVVRNEILSVFHKSKLNPDQLAALIVSNNVYIENEKPGDWTRLQNQEVEEEMYNMKHEPGYIDKDKEDKYRDPIEFNRNPEEQSFVYNKKLKQSFY